MVAVILLRRVFQRGQHLGTLGQIGVVHQVGHLQHATILGEYLMEACRRVDAFPFAQRMHDLVDFALLVFQAFAGIDVGYVDDGFQCRVQYLGDSLHITSCVEEVADVQRLKPVVAVELLVVGISDRLEFGLIRRPQHCLAVAPEIRTGHGHHMNLVACNERAQQIPQHIVRVAGNVVKFINGDQSIVECINSQLFHRKAESGVRADQYLVGACQKFAHRIHFGFRHARLVHTGGVAQVPLWRHLPIPIEAVLAQRLVGKAATDGTFRHYDDGLPQPLVVQLVQRNKHQRAGFARCRWRFDQQVLLATLGVGFHLHGAHAQFVGLARCAGARRSDGHRWHGVGIGWIGGGRGHGI